jgi:ABC-type uncharacterized transport system substrate-binding protein
VTLGQQLNVLVVFSELGIQAAQRATTTIPIVAIASDMVRHGLAPSVARPGGNLTGVNILAEDLNIKRLQILHEAVPGATRIGHSLTLVYPHSRGWIPRLASLTSISFPLLQTIPTM